MRIETKNFGEIEIDESKIIEFPEGILGLPTNKRYALLNQKAEVNGESGNIGDDLQICWLQSVDDGNVSFALMNILSLLPSYNPEVDDEELENIGGFVPEDTLVYNIAVVPENIKELRVNLKAPIIINTATKKAKQVIVNNDYPIKFFIFDLIQETKAGDE